MSETFDFINWLDTTLNPKASEVIEYVDEHYLSPFSQQVIPKEGQELYDEGSIAFFPMTLSAAHKPVGILSRVPQSQLALIVYNQERMVVGWSVTPTQLTSALNRAGWSVNTLELQDPFIAVTCTRRPKLDIKGKHIAIVGLGPSAETFVATAKAFGGPRSLWDEVWGINAMGLTLQCDRIIHMDDYRIQEIRAKAKPQSNIAVMLKGLEATSVPIYTSRVDPRLPTSIEMPLKDLYHRFGHLYFNSTVPYAIALAVMDGASQLSLFGMDYTYPNAHDAEKGRACLEFWLGIAMCHGVSISIARDSSLMDTLEPLENKLYGYDGYEVGINGSELTMDYSRELPTAEEIEHRYDHTRHPNPRAQGLDSPENGDPTND